MLPWLMVAVLVSAQADEPALVLPDVSVPEPTRDAVTPLDQLRRVALELTVGTGAGMAAGVLIPLLQAGVLFTGLGLLAGAQLQSNSGWGDLVAVILVLVGTVIIVPFTVLQIPLWDSLGFVAGAGITGAVREVRQKHGVRGLLAPAIAALACVPGLLVATVLLGLAAALIPFLFFLTNSVGLAVLGEYFPVLLVAGGGVLALVALGLYVAISLTLRPLIVTALHAALNR